MFLGESSLGDVCALLNTIPEQKIQVEGKIGFLQLAFGISPARTRFILGYPDCRYKFQYPNLRHKIYAYHKIGNLPDLIANCHFFNNQLHYVQTFIRHPDKETIIKLTGIFEKRYGYTLKDAQTMFALQNEKGEVLFYSHDLDIHLYHFSANQLLTDRIHKEFSDQQSRLHSATQQHINILEKII